MSGALDTIYHYLGMFSFWGTTGFLAGCAVMAWRERRQRVRLQYESGSVVDPFTSQETRLLVLRYRGVGHE